MNTTKLRAEYTKAQLRNGAIVVPRSDKPAEDTLVHAAVANLASYGVLVNPSELSGADVDYLTHLCSVAREVRGADRTWGTLFPHFPNGVRHSDTLDLFITQIVHYFSYGTIRPAQDNSAASELPIQDMIKGAVKVSCISRYDYVDSVVERVMSPTALPVQDVFMVLFALEDMNDSEVNSFVDMISCARFTENLSIAHYAVILRAAMKPGNVRAHVNDAVMTLLDTVDNADVLLRIILSAYVYKFTTQPLDIEKTVDDIVHLRPCAKGTRVRNVSTRVTKAIVHSLSDVSYSKQFPADVFIAHRALWLRVLSSIHAMSVSTNSTSRMILDVLFSNISYKTLNFVVDRGMKDSVYTQEAVTALVNNSPGLLLRNIVTLARNDFDAVMSALVKIHGARIPVNTIVSAINAVRLSTRETTDFRRIAGVGTQKIVRQARLNDTQAQALEDALVTNILRPVLARKDAPESAVSIGGASMKIPSSLSTRSATKQDRQRCAQGQRIALPDDGDVIRAFTHWYNNPTERVDIDLGLVVCDGAFTPLCTWSYDSVYNPIDGYSVGFNDAVVFSGDITNAPLPNGASEFYDVSIDNLTDMFPGARYVIMTNVVFSGSSTISDVDHYAGVMVRSDADEGATFDARTVTSGSTSGVTSRMSIPLAVDIETREMVWLDTDTGMNHAASSATRHSADIAQVAKDVIDTDMLSVGEILTLWAREHDVDVDESTPVDMDVLSSIIS